MHSENRVCRDCGEEFIDQFVLLPRHHCDDCTDKIIAAEAERQRLEVVASRRARFAELVPPLYRQTDKTRLLPVLRDCADKWEYGAKGLGFVGEAGAGKTRAATLILQRMNDAGFSVAWISATRFAQAAADSFSNDAVERDEAKRIIRRAGRAHLLLLDDLGKERMTDRAEMQLYDLLEHRTGHELPTIWTSNSDAAGLHAMFSPDRADAMIRRLSEFSEIIKL